MQIRLELNTKFELLKLGNIFPFVVKWFKEKLTKIKIFHVVMLGDNYENSLDRKAIVIDVLRSRDSSNVFNQDL